MDDFLLLSEESQIKRGGIYSIEPHPQLKMTKTWIYVQLEEEDVVATKLSTQDAEIVRQLAISTDYEQFSKAVDPKSVIFQAVHNATRNRPDRRKDTIKFYTSRRVYWILQWFKGDKLPNILMKVKKPTGFLVIITAMAVLIHHKSSQVEIYVKSSRVVNSGHPVQQYQASASSQMKLFYDQSTNQLMNYAAINDETEHLTKLMNGKTFTPIQTMAIILLDHAKGNFVSNISF